MQGGSGNDTYVVDAIADTTVELAGEGIDLIRSGITWTLADNVENLTLTGAAAINGTGNELDNTIIGNSAANTLTGLDGNDTLDGGQVPIPCLGGPATIPTWWITPAMRCWRVTSKGLIGSESSISYRSPTMSKT